MTPIIRSLAVLLAYPLATWAMNDGHDNGWQPPAVEFPSIDPDLVPSVNVQNPVTWVDTSRSEYDRIVMKIGDEPFFYQGAQLRVDKLEDFYGRTDEQNKEMVKLAADYGFTVLNIQHRWMDSQPDKFFNASETTHIQGGSEADSSFADSANHTIGFSTDDDSQTSLMYLKFDFSNYERDNISAAKVRVYVNEEAVDNKTFSATLYGIRDNDWSASSITWNSGAPNHNGGLISGENNTDYFVASSSPSWDRIRQANFYDFDASDFLVNHTEGTQASFILTVTPDVNNTNVGASISGIRGSNPPMLVLSDETSHDWTYIDKLMDWCLTAGIKLEPMWFGSDSTSASADIRVPYFAMRNEKVEGEEDDGSHAPIMVKGVPTTSNVGVYNYLLDKNDFRTRRLEYSAVKALFDHIGEWDEAHGGGKTVVGAGISNELGVLRVHGYGVARPWKNPATWSAFPKFDSMVSFNNRTAWEFMTNIANGVKDSKYPVWTRANTDQNIDVQTVWYNEQMRKKQGTSVDYIGVDPYTDNLTTLWKFGHQDVFYSSPPIARLRNVLTGCLRQVFAYEDNLPNVAENGGNYNNSHRLSFASLAGGSFYNVYEFYGTDNLGLFVPTDLDNGNYDPVWRGDYVQDVIDMNWGLNSIAPILASTLAQDAGGSKLAFLNKFANSTTSSTRLRGLDITLESNGWGAGVAATPSDTELILLAVAADGTFTIPALGQYGIVKVERGSYQHGSWVSKGELEYSANGDSLQVTLGSRTAIRIQSGSALGWK